MAAIIDSTTHLDHALTPEALDLVRKAALDVPEGCAFRMVNLTLKGAPVPCALHLDVPEGEVFYAPRPPRPYFSRLTTRPPTLAREVTMLAGKSKDGVTRVWTAFGGPMVAREPGDPTFAPEALKASENLRIEKLSSDQFWAKAALSAEVFGIKRPE